LFRRRAFTLLELLIVIVIIAGLIAILMPAMAGARSKGRLTACAANLRQLGMGIKSYLGDNGDILPFASYMPSLSPAPVQGDKPIYISELLAPHLNMNPEETSKAFNCSLDAGTDREAPNQGKPYFVTEKSSYEFRLGLGGTSIAEYVKRRREFRGTAPNENEIWLMRDYGNFHAVAGATGSRRYLYYDGHVTDFEN
jgi:prepilin-type N-terminal cleavage/methylation domain-containing protein